MLWQPTFTALRDALADLYDVEADIRRVAADAGLPAARLALGGKPVNMWQEVLTEAARRGRVEALLDVVTGAKEYPGDPVLRAAVYAYRHPATPRELDEARQAYLRYLEERYRYLELRGMGLSDRVSLQLPLVEMYVPLKARIELPEGETWARELRVAGRALGEEGEATLGRRLSEPQPVLELLQQHDGLVVLGDPGAGKTTFLKYLALKLIAGQADALGLAPMLPVLLPISAYATALAEKDMRLDRFICEYYAEHCANAPLDQVLRQALEEGRALILLDGLDEVREVGLRRTVVQHVEDFYVAQHGAGNKFVLSSRIVGYREVRPTAPGLVECTLADFEDEEIEQFVDLWCGALERAARGETAVAAAEAEKQRGELLDAVRRNEGVRRLAANPLLLTILALMKRQGVTLPERRAELYDQYVRTLLSVWNRVRGLGRPPTRDLDVVETMRILAPLALWMHESNPGVGLVKRGDLERELQKILAGRGEADPEVAALRFLADVREHAGLLLERGAGQYGFIHLTFEEYLAAVGVARLAQRDVPAVADILGKHIGEAAWREVALLTVGYLGIVQQWDEVASDVVAALLQRQPGPPGEALVLAGDAVVDAAPGGVTAGCRKQVVRALVETLRQEPVAARVRAAAGRTLARLGDPRPGVGVSRDTGLPDIEWVRVPEGAFRMGTAKRGIAALVKRYGGQNSYYEDETPEHEVTLSGFLISRYPVTQRQFRAFVDAQGYSNASYWTEAEVAGLWREGKLKKTTYRLKGNNVEAVEEEMTGPAPWGEPYNLDNHPVVGVTWYEALAYCRWLTDLWRDGRWVVRAGDGEVVPRVENCRITLPSEAEWEKAARGEEGLEFPWVGGADPNRANYDDTGIGSTSAVGCFPGGASPYGVEELSGNVWEWTRSVYMEYPYSPEEKGREDLAAGPEGRRVLRGGAYGSYARSTRCAARYDGYGPHGHSDLLGFRVVVASPVSL